MGYLVIGLAGTEVSRQEQQWLAHPALAGVILFSRNFADPLQMCRLTHQIRQHCSQALIMIDQEGGRVQRMKQPLSLLPPLASLGRRFDQAADEALALAGCHGELMAAEVLSLGIDLSLSPVLDLDAGSAVIGDRALHRQPEIVSRLALAYRQGMAKAGMVACGKHFPGHGTVIPDTHVDDAIDDRSLEHLMAQDLLPFAAAITQGIEALMLAHVCYPQICPQPAGYSQRWIQTLLRQQLKFTGVVISDDLGMRAAHSAGGFEQRVQASLAAGCDLLLVCRPTDVAEVMALSLPDPINNHPPAARLRGRPDAPPWSNFENSQRRDQLRRQIQCLN